MASFNDNSPETFETTAPSATKKEKKPKMVKIKLPRKKGETHAFACVNGKGYQIQRGKEVDVPDFVAEVFRNAERAEEYAEEYETRLAAEEKASLKR